MTAGPIAFIDLDAQRRRIGPRMDRAIAAVLEAGQFILGPQVGEFERQLAAFCGVPHAICTANGTDAIGLCLMALGLKPGDAVICPAFTFAATAEAVAWLGASPVFTDVDEASFNLDPKSLPLALEAASRAGLKPRAVIAVDLFGQMADYEPIEAFCRQHELALICDSAQACGAIHNGRRSGQIGDFTTVSFFPAKPLGCYGDGGAILTASEEHAAVIRSLRSHGRGDDKYDNVRIGVNSRLDTLQAAILIEKLAVFDEEIAARQVVARRYEKGLGAVVATPQVTAGCTSVWAQYTVRIGGGRRDAFIAAMKRRGVPTAVYYPKPLNQQTAYRHFPVAGNGVATSERLSGEVVSLPMHAYLDEATQTFIIAAARESLKEIAAA